MQKNITVRISLCGLLIAANTALAMKPENVLPLSLAGTPHTSPQLSPRTFDIAKAITAISDPCMPDNPRNNYSSTLQRSRSVSPIDDYDCTKSQTISQSGSQPSSPRTQETSKTKYPTYNGYFTNELNYFASNMPTYTHVRDKSRSDDFCKITCENKETNEIKTILFSGKNDSDKIIEYNKEKYIVIVDDQGKDIFTIYIDHDATTQSEEATASEEESQDRLQKQQSSKALELLKNISSDSDSEKGKETPQTTQPANQEASDKINRNTSIGLLVDIHENYLPKEITDTNKIYKGLIRTLEDTQICEVAYIDENGSQTVYLSNTKTNPTFAILTNPQDNSKFAIRLPVTEERKEKSVKSTHKQAFTPQSKNPDNGSYRKSTIMGVSFIALCITLLAYRYNKLPDAFTALLDNSLAQCKNLIPSRFAQ